MIDFDDTLHDLIVQNTKIYARNEMLSDCCHSAVMLS
jgi:hypothetical protein